MHAIEKYARRNRRKSTRVVSPEAIRADANMTVHVYAREWFRLARRVKAHNITVEQEEAYPFHGTARGEKDTLRVTQP